MRTAFEREGDVRSVDLPAAFATLWREAASGVLRFSRPGQDVRFDLADGDVVGVWSSDPASDTAQVLIRAGKLDSVALQDLPSAGDRARSARDMGLLTERDWRWGEKIRTIEILADLVTWLGGEYSLSPTESPRAGEFRIGIHRLLLELFLRSGDREFVHQSLGATDSPLQRAADFEERFAALGLTADADPVVAAIDGRATAADISRRVPPDPFSVERLLAAMTTLGLVHPEYAADGAPSRPRKAAGARPKQPAAPKEVPVRPSKEAVRISAPRPEPAPPPAAAPVPEKPAPPPPRPPAPSDEARLDEGTSAEREVDLLLDGREPPLELPLAAAPAPSGPEPEAVLTGWEHGPAEPLDRPFALPEPPQLLRPKRSSFPAVGLLVLLALAVGALLVWRARDHDASPISLPSTPPPVEEEPSPTALAGPAPIAPFEAPTNLAATASETPTSLAATATSTPLPVAVSPTESVPSPPSPTVTSSPPTRPARPLDAAPGARRSLEDWVRLAERDRRALEGDSRTQYTIQLELVCELRSLEEAWAYDRDGEMWLLTVPFGDRTCFRVFWGRYASLDEARRAKDSAPRFFFTPTNHPVVVAARRALLP